MKKGDVLALFVKYPEPGKVKTRLAARIGDDAALRWYRGVVEAQIAEHRDRPYDFVVYLAPDEKVDLFAQEHSVAVRPQSDGDLGVRMRACFDELLLQYECVAIAGSDVPGLTSVRVQEALRFARLGSVAIGPCPDGGYYLIAARSTPHMFDGIPWSTDAVLRRTLEKLRTLDMRWVLLPEEKDVDT